MQAAAACSRIVTRVHAVFDRSASCHRCTAPHVA